MLQVSIPDMTPSQLLAGQVPIRLAMCAGDFVEVGAVRVFYFELDKS